MALFQILDIILGHYRCAPKSRDQHYDASFSKEVYHCTYWKRKSQNALHKLRFNMADKLRERL